MSHGPWPIKTVATKKCRRCKAVWADDKERLEPGDQLNFVEVKIAYCPACADSFAAESERPTYERRTGKRIR